MESCVTLLIIVPDPWVHFGISVAILLSTVQDPTSFDNFTNSTGGPQLARNFATGSGEGGFCIPLNLSASGISGVTNGANVTIQLIFNGGDSSLYQVNLELPPHPPFLRHPHTENLLFLPVLGSDAFEQLYHTIQYHLFKFLFHRDFYWDSYWDFYRDFYRDFDSCDLDQHRKPWRKGNCHVGLC